MNNTFRLMAILVYFVRASTAFGADVKIIANDSVGVTSVSADDLKGIFLATRTSLSDGSHVVPVLEKSGPAHEAFLRKYLGKTDSALEAYYRSLVFTGKAAMPKSFASNAEVVAYVMKTKGAIGYVSSETQTAGCKTLELK